MHIPDGFLSAPVAVGYALVSCASLGVACQRARARGLAGQSSALLGVSAAFIFAAQMVNFPVFAGTSGHLLGGALAAALLGLQSAIIVLSSVLVVQCFLFADGGLFALGANVFNMALVSCVVGFCFYRLLCGHSPSPTRRVAAVAFAAWCATMASAASCAEQLAWSGALRLSIVLKAMLGVHALIGVGEAVISALVVSTVLRFRPELVEHPGQLSATTTRQRALLPALGIALSVIVLLVPLSSSAPDGLSRVASDLGLVAATRVVSAPLAGYAAGPLGAAWLGLLVAGCLGALLLYGSCWLLALSLVPRASRSRLARAGADPSA